MTVTRRGERDFRVVSGAATRWKDLAWIRRAGHGIDVHDATEDEAIIGVMGPRSRETLQVTIEQLTPFSESALYVFLLA